MQKPNGRRTLDPASHRCPKTERERLRKARLERLKPPAQSIRRSDGSTCGVSDMTDGRILRYPVLQSAAAVGFVTTSQHHERHAPHVVWSRGDVDAKRRRVAPRTGCPRLYRCRVIERSGATEEWRDVVVTREAPAGCRASLAPHGPRWRRRCGKQAARGTRPAFRLGFPCRGATLGPLDLARPCASQSLQSCQRLGLAEGPREPSVYCLVFSRSVSRCPG